MAENQKAEDVGDSGGGGGGSNTTPPQARPAPDKGAAVKRRRQRQQQQQQQQQQPQTHPEQRPKKALVRPTVTERVLSVAASSMERRGISLAALKKALSAMGYDVGRNNNRVNRTVRQLVQTGSLVRTSGTGASGSFRFNRTTTPKREQKAGVARRKASSRKKTRSCKPTAAHSKRSSPKRRGPKRQTKTRRTVARPSKRRPRAGVRPRAKAGARLHSRRGGPRTARDYRRSGRGRKAARGLIKRPVGRPRKSGPRRR